MFCVLILKKKNGIEKRTDWFLRFRRFKFGDNLIKLHADSTDVYEGLFVLHCRVCRWIKRFQGGKSDTENEHRPRHLNTVWNE